MRTTLSQKRWHGLVESRAGTLAVPLRNHWHAKSRHGIFLLLAFAANVLALCLEYRIQAGVLSADGSRCQ